uniref:Ribosomal protein L32 n=1 Tax=Caulerpa verticillata TaxID=177082 RepID=A0A386B0D7_9CHLO|nr:ribosomal protein L32 [Caulerpa verticillata]AYC65168.1 ribosomal protein L32 [Caulerpa verticillata]
MPVPKKKTSKSKSTRKKMLWKKKAFKKISKCILNFRSSLKSEVPEKGAPIAMVESVDTQA